MPSAENFTQKGQIVKAEVKWLLGQEEKWSNCLESTEVKNNRDE